MNRNDWWRGGVIYQVYPRSFYDSNGDGVGDLRGVVEKIDYIASLNVDAIWLSPFFTSPMKDFGYDVSDYRDVDPLFGTLEDFKQVIEVAHARGIRILIDQVLNHSSDQHAWFKESRSSRDNPKADWYVWADPKVDGTVPNNWLSVFGGPAWTWDSRRKQYYLHNFLASQPDLNFHCEAVQQQLLDDMEFWLKLGVDGFRLDAANFYFHDRQLRDNPPNYDIREGSIGVRADNPYAFQKHLYDKTQPENLGFLRRIRHLLEQYPGSATGRRDRLRSLATDHGRLHRRQRHAAHGLFLRPADRTMQPRIPAPHHRLRRARAGRRLALLVDRQPRCGAGDESLGTGQSARSRTWADVHGDAAEHAWQRLPLSGRRAGAG